MFSKYYPALLYSLYIKSNGLLDLHTGHLTDVARFTAYNPLRFAAI